MKTYFTFILLILALVSPAAYADTITYLHNYPFAPQDCHMNGLDSRGLWNATCHGEMGTGRSARYYQAVLTWDETGTAVGFVYCQQPGSSKNNCPAAKWGPLMYFNGLPFYVQGIDASGIYGVPGAVQANPALVRP